MEIGHYARLSRRRLRRWMTLLRWKRISLAGIPVLFANSFPKSGTHLLTQVLQGFVQIGPAVDSGLPAIVTFDGFTGHQRSKEEILQDLQQLLPGDIAYGHIHAFTEAIERLCRAEMAAYFILRDPRDVVVSHVHYVAEMAPSHIHHRYYHEVLKNFDERLKASIVGVSIQDLEKATGKPVFEPLPDIRARFDPYLDWLGCSEVLALRYEDFITDSRKTIQSVLAHAIQRGFQTSYSLEQAGLALEESINPHRSPTFRSGKIGGWRNSFNAEHRLLFQQVAGDLITRLGYEG